MSDGNGSESASAPSSKAQALSAAVRDGATRLREDGIAGETMWGLIFEAVSLVSTLLAFTMLGRSLGTGGYGDYASLYAIIGPLGVLAASGVTALAHGPRTAHPVRISSRPCGRACRSRWSSAPSSPRSAYSSPRGWYRRSALTTIGAVILLEFVSQPVGQIAATTVQVTSGFTPSMQVRMIPLAGRVIIILVLASMDRLTITTLGVTHLVCSIILSVVLMGVVARHYGIKGPPVAPRSGT